MVKKSIIANSITEAIEINVCHPFNLRDPSQTLLIKKLKGIYFKDFLTSSPYLGINGTKLVAISTINIRKTPPYDSF
jgi:hypothetical protein